MQEPTHRESGELARRRAAEAGSRAVDPDRTLPGENLGTRDPDDARHWVAVYRELVSFKESVIGQTQQEAHAQRAEVAAELEAGDLPLFENEAERLRQRLTLWESRLRELER